MSVPHLIFDFDGVIGDTYEAAITAHIQYGERPTRESAIVEMESYFTKKPNHTRTHTLTEEELEGLRTWTSDFGMLMHTVGFALFEEFVKEVESIKTAYKAVVSSGSQNYVLPALAKTKIQPTHILAFENHHSKEDKIEQICTDWGIDVQSVYYFTDTLADVYELRDFLAPDKLIGVSWGYCAYDVLAKELEEQYILKTPREIHKLFN